MSTRTKVKSRPILSALGACLLAKLIGKRSEYEFTPQGLPRPFRCPAGRSDPLGEEREPTPTFPPCILQEQDRGLSPRFRQKRLEYMFV